MGGLVGGGGGGGLLGGLLGGGGGGGPLGGGNPLGAMGMDLSMHKMPVVGGFFQNPQETFMQDQMQRGGQAYGMYRPEAAQGGLNAMNMTAQQMQPVNNALASMYGPQATQGSNFNYPMGPSMFQRGQPNYPGQQQGGGQGGGDMSGGLLGGSGGLGGLLGGGGPGGIMQGLLGGGMPGMGGFGQGLSQGGMPNMSQMGFGALGMNDGMGGLGSLLGGMGGRSPGQMMNSARRWQPGLTTGETSRRS